MTTDEILQQIRRMVGEGSNPNVIADGGRVVVPMVVMDGLQRAMAAESDLIALDARMADARAEMIAALAGTTVADQQQTPEQARARMMTDMQSGAV